MNIGDLVMVDEGFTIADILSVCGMTLNIPPRKNADLFTAR